MDSWRVLFPWCRWVRGRLQLQEPPHSTVKNDLLAYHWLLVALPKHQRNASSDLLPKIRETLGLLSLVAAVDAAAFCDILRDKCGVEGTFNMSKLRVIFVLDDHTSRSLLWPEAVCKALLAWDGAPPSEDFLLTKEEVESIAEKKMRTSLSKVDIPFCLHFAPRDINSVGLQQYLQSVQRVLHEVMPASSEVEKENVADTADNQERSGDIHGSGSKLWPFVFEALQLNLRDFELNESVARALKELVLLGAKVSCLQLPLKATDFLSEDECPRQPLADCLLAIAGGGPRSQLFSSTFAQEPQDDDGTPWSPVETLVINDVDIDDRRFAALCSALRGATGVKELVLESAFVQDAQRAREVKWKWLAFALFTPSSEKSSVSKLAITEPQLLADDVAAIASIVNAHKPARELLDPLWAEHEAHQRMVLSEDEEDKSSKNQQEWSGSTAAGDDMLRLHKGTVVYLEPLCSQDEWLQASVVLERDGDFVIMNASNGETIDTKMSGDEEDWLEILVPGYGKCWVHPDTAHGRYTSATHSEDWSGISELSLVAQVAKSSTDKIFTQLFQLIGHDLVSLSLHTNILREQGLGSILRSCPSLRKLQLNGAQVDDMFAFTHGYDVGYCQIESLSIEHFRVSAASLAEFAHVLSDPDREAARHLRELCIGKLRIQDIDSALADYDKMMEAFAQMLDTNSTLEYLKLYIEGDFYARFMKSFMMHNNEQLAVGLSTACKLALISVLRSGESQRLGEHLISRVFRYAARQISREVCIINY
ncbi:hypothetical protein PRIC2_011052 [Phytophthora ramorum]